MQEKSLNREKNDAITNDRSITSHEQNRLDNSLRVNLVLKNFILSGTFMTTEASRPSYPMDVAMMESRTFLDHYKCLSFWYHMFGRKMGSLSVYAIKSNEEERILLAEISGNMGNHWRLMEINLDQDDFDLAGVFKVYNLYIILNNLGNNVNIAESH